MKRLRLAVALGFMSFAPMSAWAQMPESHPPVTPTTQPSPEDLDTGLKGLLGSDRKDNDIYFRDVAKELRCPTCTGLSVLESDASFSVQIKDQVHEQMKLGKSKDEIIKYFVERYGPWILREPPKEGFNLLAWGVPIALLIGGPILIWLLVWRRKVQFNAHGVRSTEALIKEMHDRLLLMKEKKG
ncbi:MAG TPA: cytochrome c-type biogenesis protein [Oligoflexus sp.]|uniref:cytochrome c-type biogenesis protein n=1 Tax=Oligoflexus sp. TaxID=1971216 RepID=UPI002D80E22C|nr:cytochrome c-type biogenesis protein [Oligoflexus sp.]HET9235677.1 cytochrome c-type biogenesis protein [Oligoflexus sp.]